MYARELRKWSLKYRMSFLWLSAIVTMLLLITYCPTTVTSMKLPMNTNRRDTSLQTPSTDSSPFNWWLNRLSNSNRINTQQIDSDNTTSDISNNTIRNLTHNYNPLAVFNDFKNHHARAIAAAPVNVNYATGTDHNSNSNYYVPNVPNSNSQINYNLNPYANSLTKNAYSEYSKSRSSKLRRHTNQPKENYHSPVRVTENHPPPSPYTMLSQSTLNYPPRRYNIATFHEIPPSELSTLTPLKPEDDRRLLLRPQSDVAMLLTARNRRNLATSVSTSPRGYMRSSQPITSSNRQYHQQRQQQQRKHQHQHHHQRQHQHHNHRNTNANINTFMNTNSNSNTNINHNHNTNHNKTTNSNYHPNINRRRPHRYCSARDPQQLAFEAPTVFLGKITSKSSGNLANFSVTVEVKERFKEQNGMRLPDYVRLKFTRRNTSAECDIYRESLRPLGLARNKDLEPGGTYIIFGRHDNMGNFSILGQPIRRTKRVVEAVKYAVSKNYAQLATIKSLTANNRIVEDGKELRIVCKVQGQPPPKVTWFKDHRSINQNRKLYKFIHYKRRSELIIRSFNSSDAGRYECRAKNRVNRNLERRAIVIKAYPMPRYDAPTQQAGGKCPEGAAEFCFNGGTCIFFAEITSYSCICPEGFIGERCDRKEVPPIPTYKTGYIADDPNAFIENRPVGNINENSENDYQYPSTRNSLHNFNKY